MKLHVHYCMSHWNLTCGKLWFLSSFFITSKAHLEAVKAIQIGQEYETVGRMYTAGEDVNCD